MSDRPPLRFMGVVALADLGSLQRSTTASLRSGRGKNVEHGRGAPRSGVVEGPKDPPECTTAGGDPGRGVL